MRALRVQEAGVREGKMFTCSVTRDTCDHGASSRERRPKLRALSNSEDEVLEAASVCLLRSPEVMAGLLGEEGCKALCHCP